MRRLQTIVLGGSRCSATGAELERSMRGFLAFGVNQDFSKALESAVAGLNGERGLRFLPSTDLHVTIKYLSTFSSTDLIACLPELLEIGEPDVALEAGKIAVWPTVLALECSPSEKLRVWHGNVNRLLERKGFIKERHPHFSPHITIARLKPEFSGSVRALLIADIECAFCGQRVGIESASLWQSQAEETGRRHRPFLTPLWGRY